ncbi:MAG: hypothetical protein Q7R70_03130 [Candidatus Diapherotrites archaeon]|nr:hypothetical protein [Candidatus Diapherotrites archaeon]
MPKSLDSKGQSIFLDLAFGVFLFLLLFAFIYSQWQTNISVASQESDFEELSSRALMSCDSLVSSAGTPANWFLLSSADDINTIGIARKKRSLDDRKLSRFLSLDYNVSQQKLKLSGFDFYFHLFNSNGIDFNYGVSPDSNKVVVSLRRIVDYQGVESIVDCSVYRQE